MWGVSVLTAQAHLFLITSQGCGIVHRSTGIQVSKPTLTKGAARCLMFLQKGVFKWVSRYCKTQSSLLCCSESICQCLWVICTFSFKRCSACCTCLTRHTGFHSWFWWNCFPLDPIISCDCFSWTSLFGTKAIFGPVDQNSGLVKALQTHPLHCCWSCLVQSDPLAASDEPPGKGELWCGCCTGASQGMQPLNPHFLLFTLLLTH